ncbi:hypothetical protein EON63_18390 [archaeon]|nr:MAG: hypothetical protein EON63_18390 [archaeon]
MNRIYHSTAVLIAVITPVALIAPPNPLTMPIDATISLLLPLHSHVALNYVVSLLQAIHHTPSCSRLL